MNPNSFDAKVRGYLDAMLELIKMVQDKVRNIGLDVEVPSTDCDDDKCPFHGNLFVRGRIHTNLEQPVYAKWLFRNFSLPK